ncbi:MAG: rhodanese-like domain-containing protein [Mycobacteriales bacterium]
MSREVGLDELEAARSAGETVLDVREVGEFIGGHVPGVVLMPLAVLPVRMHELPKDQPVYLICRSGARSFQAAHLLAREGLQARSVAGGTDAWIRSGRPVETGLPKD